MVQKSLDWVYPNPTSMTRRKVDASSIGGLDANHLFKVKFSYPFILIIRYVNVDKCIILL